MPWCREGARWRGGAMRVLVCGGDGMLGHVVAKMLSPRHDVAITVRRHPAKYAPHPLLRRHRMLGNVDAMAFDTVREALDRFAPEAVVNAVGLVKQRQAAAEPIPALEVNSLFPHRLARASQERRARLVHFSTDCVFSGRDGDYTEDSVPDCDDLYGRTKLLGEVDAPGCITLRTSLIGRELGRTSGLVEWFLSQTGEVKGFRNAIYTGFTTIEMARIVEMLLTRFPLLSGIWHVSSAPISKYDLLLLLKKHFRTGPAVTPDDAFRCDRSLRSDRFRDACGYRPPSWDEMIGELAIAGESNV